MALLGSLLWDSLAALVLIVGLILWYATLEFDFFKKRGVPYVKPLPIVGNFLGVLTGRDNMNSAVVPLYEQLKRNKFGGIFLSRTPVVLVCDPEMAKMVLTKDFTSLHDRGLPYDEENDPLSANLFNLPGARWKNLRNKLTPTFTSGKLKQMFPIIKDVSNSLTKLLHENAINGEDIDMRGILVRYCTDVIGTCAFGIECNSLSNPKSEFYVMSRTIFKPSILASIRFAIFAHSKLLLKLLPFKWVFPGAQKFFIDLMRETVKFRKENNVERNDFVHLMMQLQKSDEGKDPKDHPDEVIFSDNIMTAQAFIFFFAGLDSIANTVGFALYHLALDPTMQEDLADEIISVLRNHDDEFTYEALKEMKMVRQVISETLRMYTPAGLLFRHISAPSYTVPGTDLTLKSGMKVTVAVQGLHFDPDIYPEPMKFDPSRFMDEEIAKRHPYAYIPFGEGPRVCIANRFALLECKLCLASLIKDFRFSVCSKTEVPIRLEARSFGPTPKNGFNFKIEIRKT